MIKPLKRNVLLSCIKRAEENGLTNSFWMMKQAREGRTEFIYDHEFAKYLFGSCWLEHLKELITCEDPIVYLKSFSKKGNINWEGSQNLFPNVIAIELEIEFEDDCHE